MAFQYYNWEEVNINWETLNLNWEEVGFLVSEVLPNLGTYPSGKKKTLKKLNELPEEKKRKIIKIVCTLTNNDEYINYKYKNEDIKITATDVNIIIEELFKNKIKVDVQIIS